MYRLRWRYLSCITFITILLTIGSFWLSIPVDDEVIIHETPVNWSTVMSSCQKKFNDEFNTPIGTDLPIPISIFHKEGKLTLVATIQNYQNGNRPDRVRNFSSELISYARDWFQTTSWSIKYKLPNDKVEKANCKPIGIDNMIPNVVIVICDINPTVSK